MDIFGIQKLEEQIAVTKDSGTRKQLQELLDERKKKAKEIQTGILIILAILGTFLLLRSCMDIYHENKMGQMELEHQQRLIDHGF